MIVSAPLRVALLGALLFVTILASGTSSYGQETQPGDACTPAETDLHRTVGGPENPGAGLLLVCDGTTWNRVYEYDNNANLGVKQSAPKAPLHVGGEASSGIRGLFAMPTVRAACAGVVSIAHWRCATGLHGKRLLPLFPQSIWF